MKEENLIGEIYIDPAPPINEVVENPESRLEQLRRYAINLEFLSSGMIIRIGCKHIAFSTVEEGMTALNSYVEDPHSESEKWYKIFNQ